MSDGAAPAASHGAGPAPADDHVEKLGPTELRDPLIRQELKKASVWLGLAVALLAVGAILALPVTPALELLDPLRDLAGNYGLRLDRELGYLCLFAGDVLLIAGSLLPGI